MFDCGACWRPGGGAMNTGTLESARLRHPAGSRWSGPSATGGAPVLRLVPPLEPDRGVAGLGGGRPGRSGARLTRRGRAVALGALVVAVFGAGLASGTHAVGADSRSSAPPPQRWLLVQPGQTLWSIARAVDPDADPRSTVARLIEPN